MKRSGLPTEPSRKSYDVVIVGGAIMGSSTAWFLAADPDFDGSVLVIERAPTYEFSSTARTNSCIRQQFGTELNVRISQFGAAYYKNLRSELGGDERVPELSIQSFGYLYLAGSEGAAQTLRANQAVQLAAGAATELLSPDEIAARYPFYALDDVVLGSINTVDEGYFDGQALFDWWRRKARESGVEFIENEVLAMDTGAGRVQSLTLARGEEIVVGHVVNASGPAAAKTAAMAGIALPIEPRKRFSWIFRAENPLDEALPLTIDPSGIHVRENGGGTYLAGCKPDVDDPPAPDDFNMDHAIWETHVWPTLATRIPQFEAIRVESEWAGHYEFNTLDQNAILGGHPSVTNFVFINGFSGHGLQQSAAAGRATAEWITHGAFRTIDMSPLSYERVASGTPFVEPAVI
ncbi:MAG: FAD-binding oxidoreductase [Pseudomonadota bacterium]